MTLKPSIDKAKIALRFAQAQQSYDQHAVVQQRIVQQLLHFIQQYAPQHAVQQMLDIGCGSGQLTRLLMQNFTINTVYVNDLYPQIQQHFLDFSPQQFCLGDIETLALPSGFDWVVSSSAFQWINDLSRLLDKIAQHMQPQGLLCFSSFASDNLTEIKQLTGQGLNYVNLTTLQHYLSQSGFEILHLSQSLEYMYFDHPKQVLQHLKATGVTATSADFKWNKTSLSEFYQAYDDFKLADRSVACYPLTYHPVYCIARRMV